MSGGLEAFPYTRVAITGAAGFIGSRVCAMLEEAGRKVLAIDNLSVGLPQLAGTAFRTVATLDLRDRAGIKDLIADFRPQAVLHLAAVHHIPTCEREPWKAFDTNIMGTQALLEAIEGTDCAGLVMASSGAVYDWSEGPLSEDRSPLHAHDVYATTKLANEYQLSAWAKRMDKRAHMGRLFNTIGANDPNGHLIPDIIGQIDRTATHCQVALGNVKPRRDYIYVDDAAAGFLTLLGDLENGPAFDVFNVCRGEDFTVAEIVHTIGEILGVSIEITTDPARMRKIDRLQQLGDTSKTKERTGWSARHTLRDALERIIAALPAGQPAH